MTIAGIAESEPTQFVWSYSKLKSFETCPRKFYEQDILKAWPEERSEQLAFGDAVHAAMALSLRTQKPLPLAYASYQPWIDRVNNTPGELLVESECKWACTRELKPTTFFSKTAWARTVCDAVKVDLEEPAVALVVDWKTGKSINVDDVQLTLMALMTFIQFPTVQKVRAVFAWLQEDDETNQVIERKETRDLWAEILPRVSKLQIAMEAEEFPPTPNRLCRRYCPVRTCEFWGK